MGDRFGEYLTPHDKGRQLSAMFGFRDIEIIGAIVRQGGFRAASEATGLAQSAISRRVRHLEDRMGVTLFERDGRGVRLTAAGRRLVEETEMLVAQRDRILSELTQGVIAGVVRLGVAETITHTVLPRMLTDLRGRHPLLRFEISVDTSEKMSQMLIDDELDVAILMRDQAPRGIDLTPLPPVGLGWYAAPQHFTLPGPVKGIGLSNGRQPPYPAGMTKPSPFRYFKTSPEVIRLAVMLYVRFSLSLRNVEDLLHERGIDICHETIRQWWMRFGPVFASEIRKSRVSRLRSGTQWRWHLDEVFVKIRGERHYLWRAVDHEGEVLEEFVSKKRDRKAALKFLKKLIKRYGSAQEFVTDKLRSYPAAMREIGLLEKHVTGQHLNNRAENSHLPFRRRERAMLRFRRMRSLQIFVTVHASVYNHFNQDRSLSKRHHFKLNRTAALAEWRQLAAA